MNAPPPPPPVAYADDVDVNMLSADEWKASAQRALARLGLTYDQLQMQAEDRNFVSTAARKLWVAIGGTL